MIMFDDGQPVPEDEDHQDAVDELNQQLQVVSNAYNAAPDPEMGNLSPEQVTHLIYAPWGEPGSPIQFHTNMPLADLDKSELFVSVRTMLLAVVERGGVKATASKNLTRRFVSEMMEILLTEEQREEIYKYRKTINEKDVWPVHDARVVAQVAGMLRLNKGKFVVPAKWTSLLTPERAGELFMRLFKKHFTKSNLAYFDNFPEVRSIQSCVGYTFYRLGIVATDWHDVEDLPVATLLPAVRIDIEDQFGGHPFVTVNRLYVWRILMPLIRWGLLEGRYEHRESKHVKSLVSIRPTPLYGKFFCFHVA